MGLSLEAEGVEMMRPSFLPRASQTCVCACARSHRHPHRAGGHVGLPFQHKEMIGRRGRIQLSEFREGTRLSPGGVREPGPPSGQQAQCLHLQTCVCCTEGGRQEVKGEKDSSFFSLYPSPKGRSPHVSGQRPSRESAKPLQDVG